MASQIIAHQIHSMRIKLSDSAKCLPNALCVTSCGELKIKIAIWGYRQPTPIPATTTTTTHNRKNNKKTKSATNQIHFAKETKAIPANTHNEMAWSVSPLITSFQNVRLDRFTANLILNREWKCAVSQCVLLLSFYNNRQTERKLKIDSFDAFASFAMRYHDNNMSFCTRTTNNEHVQSSI